MKFILFSVILSLSMQSQAQQSPESFIGEKQLQAELNKAVASFSQSFFKVCDGTGCRTCHPDQIMKIYWDQQIAVIAKNQFVFSPHFRSPKLAERIRPHFESFTKTFCQLPSNIWKTKKVEPECEKKLLLEIAYELRFYFRIPENEGDVCGQL